MGTQTGSLPCDGLSPAFLCDIQEYINDLSSSDVVTKYKSAAEITNKALKAVVDACKPGAKVVDLCDLGDKLIEEESAKVRIDGFKSPKDRSLDPPRQEAWEGSAD